jgi:hypothetical protein
VKIVKNDESQINRIAFCGNTTSLPWPHVQKEFSNGHAPKKRVHIRAFLCMYYGAMVAQQSAQARNQNQLAIELTFRRGITVTKLLSRKSSYLTILGGRLFKNVL